MPQNLSQSQKAIQRVVFKLYERWGDKKNKYQLVCHTGNCIFIDKKYSKKLKIPKKFLNNRNVDLLFDTTWFNKKENVLKKILKILLHKKIIELLRNINNSLLRYLDGKK